MGRILHEAAHVVVKGGMGFVPIPENFEKLSTTALHQVAELHALRQQYGTEWNDSLWGYNKDDKGQYNRGLSQWRPDERKTTFHFERQTPEVLAGQRVSVENWEGLFGCSAQLYRELETLGLELVEVLDKVLPGYNFLSSCQEGTWQNFVRWLVYEKRAKQKLQTAFPHRDRNFVSLVFNESAPGLLIGPNQHSLSRIHIPRGYAGVFPSRKFSQMTNGYVPSLWHATTEVPQLERQGRRSGIFFLHSNVELIREPGEL